ncbi:MAG: hypothetical protein QE285_21630 [Aquabacterium sp.]|nr:hypothetical protein [Aquabacterium sp.]
MRLRGDVRRYLRQLRQCIDQQQHPERILAFSGIHRLSAAFSGLQEPAEAGRMANDLKGAGVPR